MGRKPATGPGHPERACFHLHSGLLLSLESSPASTQNKELQPLGFSVPFALGLLVPGEFLDHSPHPDPQPISG